eukprot:TRINITY_DN3840_c1_g1_i7.p1 TRINITY_DN3840_c1_g1~~TRINITY_DN3840_c1_g1_i7.p1  ORF type:complete len:672 (+),score=116.89 TRINITY_DN3840_c1_g1_i7:190-2205(+)
MTRSGNDRAQDPFAPRWSSQLAVGSANLAAATEGIRRWAAASSGGAERGGARQSAAGEAAAPHAFKHELFTLSPEEVLGVDGDASTAAPAYCGTGPASSSRSSRGRTSSPPAVHGSLGPGAAADAHLTAGRGGAESIGAGDVAGGRRSWSRDRGRYILPSCSGGLAKRSPSPDGGDAAASTARWRQSGCALPSAGGAPPPSAFRGGAFTSSQAPWMVAAASAGRSAAASVSRQSSAGSAAAASTGSSMMPVAVAVATAAASSPEVPLASPASPMAAAAAAAGGGGGGGGGGQAATAADQPQQRQLPAAPAAPFVALLSSVSSSCTTQSAATLSVPPAVVPLAAASPPRGGSSASPLAFAPTGQVQRRVSTDISSSRASSYTAPVAPPAVLQMGLSGTASTSSLHGVVAAPAAASPGGNWLAPVPAVAQHVASRSPSPSVQVRSKSPQRFRAAALMPCTVSGSPRPRAVPGAVRQVLVPRPQSQGSLLPRGVAPVYVDPAMLPQQVATCLAVPSSGVVRHMCSTACDSACPAAVGQQLRALLVATLQQQQCVSPRHGKSELCDGYSVGTRSLRAGQWSRGRYEAGRAVVGRAEASDLVEVLDLNAWGLLGEAPLEPHAIHAAGDFLVRARDAATLHRVSRRCSGVATQRWTVAANHPPGAFSLSEDLAYRAS